MMSSLYGPNRHIFTEHRIDTIFLDFWKTLSYLLSSKNINRSEKPMFRPELHVNNERRIAEVALYVHEQSLSCPHDR